MSQHHAIETLFHGGTESKDLMPIMPIANGRFSMKTLNSEYSIVDNDTAIEYTHDTLRPLIQCAYTNITSLTDTSVMSVPYLFALAVEPLLLPLDILQSEDRGPKAFFKYGALFNDRLLSPDQVIWIYPDGGVATSTPGYVYVPYASKYGIDNEGDIIVLETGVSLVNGHNREDKFKLSLDRGGAVEIDIPSLLLAAFGKYNERTYLLSPEPINPDSTHADYMKLTNWFKTYERTSDKAVANPEVDPRIANV